MSGLTGKRVLVTRAREQAGALAEALRKRDAAPVLLPTIATEPVDPSKGLDDALGALTTYAWVVFTSVNGVRFFLDRRAALGDAPWPAGVRIAAVGSSTAQALTARGLRADAMPEAFRGDALPAVLSDVRGRRVLLPRSNIGRQAIVDGLEGAGAEIHDLPVYRTVVPTPDPGALAQLRRGVDIVTFTSPSTLRNFLVMLGDEARQLLAAAIVASIGPVTTEAALAEGIRVDVQPQEYTVPGLVDALARHMEVVA
jgi:uroporphyrinogen-III synthase